MLLISLFYVQYCSFTCKTGLNLLCFLLFLVEFISPFIPDAYKLQKQQQMLFLMHYDYMNIMIIQIYLIFFFSVYTLRNMSYFYLCYYFFTQTLASACWVIVLVYFLILFTQVLGHFNAGLSVP